MQTVLELSAKAPTPGGSNEEKQELQLLEKGVTDLKVFGCKVLNSPYKGKTRSHEPCNQS
jgi:hypothetical protein